MAFNKKTWKNRISENPLRRIITNITTGVSETVDVTRYEGIITEAGDAFSAANMNDLENRIEQGINDAGSSDIIAPTEEGPLSANAYTVGQYLIYNKINYRVVQPIAVGNSLVPGTNLVEKKVADELSNHLVVNGNAFYFDVHDGEFGYNTSELRGADTFVPFKRTPSTAVFGAYNNTGQNYAYVFIPKTITDMFKKFTVTGSAYAYVVFDNTNYPITIGQTYNFSDFSNSFEYFKFCTNTGLRVTAYCTLSN